MFDRNIENSPAEPALPAFVGQFRPPLINRRDLAWTLGVLAVVTLFCDILQKLGFSEANIITLDILAVLIIAGFVSRREYGFLASAVCVLVFNFLFTTPRYAFKADDIDTQFTLLVMLISAFITSSFAARFKRQARIASLAAYRTGVLLETNQLLQQENSAEGLLRLTAAQLNKLLKRDTLFCPVGEKGPGDPELFCTATPDQGRRGPSPDTLEERSAARAACLQQKQTGAFTDTLPGTSFRYSPVSGADSLYGIIGVRFSGSGPDDFEDNLIQAILGECAMAMEKERLSRIREEEAANARTQQLRADLLRSISHDLRTPLTSISGNAGILLNDTGHLAETRKKQVCQDIYDDSMWLINLVENLLSITRMEGGTMQLNMEGELLEEVIGEAMRHINRKASEHTLSVTQEGDFLLARMDSRLIIQVIINLVDNAIKYTPPGSHIQVRAFRRGDFAVVEIADDGPGIPDSAKERVFDMFYTASNKPADSKRGMGLGLALCRSIVTAHGGQITVSDRIPHGCVFQFTLPIEEVDLHE